MNPPARIPFIDALKGLAIVGVLFAHMGFSARFDAATLDHILLLQTLTGWCVLAFFFASGFLHAHADAGRDLKNFTQRRAVRLLIPCAAFSWMNKLLLLAASAGGFLHTDAAPSLATPADILAFVFVPAAPQFYFLAHLFIIAVLVHALLKARLLAHPFAPWLLAVLLLQSYWFLPLAKPHGEALTQFPLYAAVYLSGLGLVSNLRLFRSRSAALPAAKTSGWRQFAGIMLFYATIAVGIVRPALLYALVPLALALITTFFFRRILPPFAALGKKSGAIFAWHAPLIMTAFSIALVKFSLTGWPLIAAMTVLTIAASILLDSLVRRFDKRGIFRL